VGAKARRRASIALLGLATASAAGCKATMPSCDREATSFDEEPHPGFFVVPQFRAEAANVTETERALMTFSPELYFGGDAAGATVGYVNMAGEDGVVIGASAFRYFDGLRLFSKDGWIGSLTLPDLNGRMTFLGTEPDPILAVALTTDLAGFRAARCLGHAACFHATIRGPTIGPAALLISDDPAVFEADNQLLGALVLGGALDVETWLLHPPSPVDPAEVPLDHRRVFVEAVRAVIFVDGQVGDEEKKAFEDLKAALTG
jgi:hypothetical protein